MLVVLTVLNLLKRSARICVAIFVVHIILQFIRRYYCNKRFCYRPTGCRYSKEKAVTRQNERSSYKRACIKVLLKTIVTFLFPLSVYTVMGCFKISYLGDSSSFMLLIDMFTHSLKIAYLLPELAVMILLFQIFVF